MTTEDRDPVSVPSDDDPRSRSSHVSGRDAGRRERKEKKHLPVWQETLLLLAFALVLAIVIKALFIQAFYIPSESMEPGLVKNDRILVEKPSYWFGTPQRGDVVVFSDPGGWLDAEESAGPSGTIPKALSKVGLYPTGGHLVKRVIGVEGDVIKCCDKQGRIMVNGQPLDEGKYARLGGGECYGPMVPQGDCDWQAGPVPKGEIFVMGDNRNNSADSSYHLCPPKATDCTSNPYVDTDDVVGKVVALLWPAGRFKILHRPDSFSDVPDPK